MACDVSPVAMFVNKNLILNDCNQSSHNIQWTCSKNVFVLETLLNDNGFSHLQCSVRQVLKLFSSASKYIYPNMQIFQKFLNMEPVLWILFNCPHNTCLGNSTVSNVQTLSQRSSSNFMVLVTKAFLPPCYYYYWSSLQHKYFGIDNLLKTVDPRNECTM